MRTWDPPAPRQSKKEQEPGCNLRAISRSRVKSTCGNQGEGEEAGQMENQSCLVHKPPQMPLSDMGRNQNQRGLGSRERSPGPQWDSP